MITNRIQYLSAIGFVTVGLAAVSGAASAPGGGDESSARPPVGRVAQELAQSGAKSVIVFVSDDGKEYVAFYSALLSGRILSNASRATMKKTIYGAGLGVFATDLPCGRAWGHDGFMFPDYETHVSASEGGDRVAVVSDRGFPGHLPPVGRVLLCAEPPLAARSAQGRAKIAFVSLLGPAGILYVANADGSGPRWLSLNAIGPPAWSPDGRKIAVVSGRHGPENPEIYVMNADGSGQRRLTRNAAFDRGPAWSPDGRKIAFLRERDGKSGVYVMNADGSAQRRIALDASLEAPAWSPDGRTLAFLTKRDGNWEIYLVNADGTGQRNLTRHPASDTAWDWSPDGRGIAFLSKRGGSWGVHVTNADGSGLQTLARNATPSEPAWSPDGRKIAFVSRQEIYVVNADGSGQRRLTRNSTWDFGPVWSPDGRKIAFGRAGEIYVMNADGSGQRNLTRSPWDEFWLAWSPAPSR